MPKALAVEQISKRYGGVEVLAGVDFTVEAASFVSLLGPSGCGKTTLLRIIAGILRPDSGRVVLDGRDVTSDPPFARDLAMVFQDYALFPHMNIFDNVAFGIRMRGSREEKARVKERVREVLSLVRLGDLEARFPSELSGGQQQRVAIARALAPRPSLLLMDEPLSNLDAKVREEMRSELKGIQQQAAVTTVYVTHDQEEALALSDRIIVMTRGQVAQIASPDEVYRFPRDRFVATFVGRANVFNGMPSDRGWKFDIHDGPSLTLAEQCDGAAETVVIRPEQIEISAVPTHGDNCFPGVIVGETFIGATTYTVCEVAGIQLSILALNRVGAPRFVPGQSVFATISPAAVRPIGEREPFQQD